jgi:hypothetical protein
MRRGLRGPLSKVPNLMSSSMQLVGFDRREPITIPPLHEAQQWEGFYSARRAMLPGCGQAYPAPSYLTGTR